MKLEEAVKESRSGDVADTGTSPDTLSTPSKVKEHPVEWATAQAVSADSKCDYIVYTMRDQKNEVVAVLIETLPHERNGPCVDSIICVATHSVTVSHSSHRPTSPMATAIRAIACHKRQQECFIYPCHLSVHELQSTWYTIPVFMLNCSIIYGFR